MRRRGSGSLSHKMGCLTVFVGIFVLLALVLPPGFWWFIFGAVLIYAGFWILKCR